MSTPNAAACSLKHRTPPVLRVEPHASPARSPPATEIRRISAPSDLRESFICPREQRTRDRALGVAQRGESILRRMLRAKFAGSKCRADRGIDEIIGSNRVETRDNETINARFPLCPSSSSILLSAAIPRRYVLHVLVLCPSLSNSAPGDAGNEIRGRYGGTRGRRTRNSDAMEISGSVDRRGDRDGRVYDD